MGGLKPTLPTLFQQHCVYNACVHSTMFSAQHHSMGHRVFQTVQPNIAVVTLLYYYLEDEEKFNFLIHNIQIEQTEFQVLTITKKEGG